MLGGCAAVEKAAKDGGFDVQVPFRPGRTDASQEQTDVESFAVLEPDADGFRNYIGSGHHVPAEHLLVERAFRLTLSAPEMTVLVGGLRALNVNGRADQSWRLHEAARNADQRLLREPHRHEHGVEADLRRRGGVRGTQPGQRSIRCGPPAASTSCSDRTPSSALWRRSTRATTRKEKFVRDFVAAWDKVMNLDRFDLAR